MHAGGHGGRSVLFNGHLDVVPPGPEEMWRRPPYMPVVEGGWLYGRGAGGTEGGSWVVGGGGGGGHEGRHRLRAGGLQGPARTRCPAGRPGRVQLGSGGG